jgi:isocitrate/isopropylmalate dehydrogenase
MPTRVTLIPGDGIGPGITDATLRILGAAGADIQWDWQVAGMAAVREHGDPMPQSIFEAVHGTAPDIAGKGIANPSALVLAACMMLDHIGDRDRAARVRAAVEGTIREGKTVTRDLGGSATTDAFAGAIVARLG